MEGGVPTADTSAFRDCFALTWTNPYILRLALSAGIGGLLFGYDTGLYKYNSLSLSLSLYACVCVYSKHVFFITFFFLGGVQEWYQELFFTLEMISTRWIERLTCRWFCLLPNIYHIINACLWIYLHLLLVNFIQFLKASHIW